MKRTITITFDDASGAGWDVQEDGKYCDGLCWDEMLGQVAVLTVPTARVGSGYAMRTTEEWAALRADREGRMRLEKPVQADPPLQLTVSSEDTSL